MKWLFALVLFLLSITAFFWPQIEFSRMSPQKKVSYLLEQDLKSLEKKNLLPKAWSEINSIEVYSGTKEKGEWLDQVDLRLPINPSGNKHLEIQLLPWDNDEGKGVGINFHLIDKESKNTIWEFGRTFSLSGNKGAS